MQTFKFFFFALALASGCNPESKKTNANRAGKGNLEKNAGDANSLTEKVPFDYPSRYCSNVWTIKLRADIKDELSYFCDEKKPTEAMLEIRKSAIDNPGKVEIKKIKGDANPETDTSDFILVWSYYVPQRRPFEVKARPIYSYIAQDFNSDKITMATKAERQSDNGLDNGMHLWNVNMAYDLRLKAAPGIDLEAKRKTQYNLYQVESGNEEMGFGVETLTDGNNGDFSRSVMINLSFNDGKGYNDGVGGAVVLNMLHLTMNNKGFPQTTSEAIDELGRFLAEAMYAGISAK